MTKERTTAAQKKERARKTVDDLVGDLSITQTLEKKGTPKKDVIAEIEKNKSKTWLQDQVDELTKKNRELEDKIIALQQNDGNSEEYTTLKNGVIIMFQDLENNFLGKNPQNISYEYTKVQKQLDRMIERFPFLHPTK